MPTESELRSALHGSTGEPSRPLDADDIIRRARRRRTPKQVIVGSASALALAAVVIVGANGLPGLLGVGSMSADFRSDGALAPESATGLDESTSAGGVSPSSVAQALNMCGSEVASLPGDPAGPTLSVAIPETAAADGGTISGTATLTNSGSAPFVAATRETPTVTIAQDGKTRWHSHSLGASQSQLIELAPGESAEFGVSLDLVACESVDEGEDGFRTNLPALGAGSYLVSVVLEITGDDRGPGRLIQSESVPLTLR